MTCRTRLRDVCLSDYFSIPTIEAVDLSRYNGRPGGTVRCRAFEKYPLAGVKVYLTGTNGAYETGAAVRRGKTWTYTATTAMPSGTVKVYIVATDHADQSATHSSEWPAGN